MLKAIIVFVGLLFLFAFLFLEVHAQSTSSPNGFGTIVYASGSMYFAKDSQNNIIISSDTPNTVIKTALARGGEIYISGGTYYMPQDFSGFDLKTGTHLKLAKDAYIIVPSGYGGYVFRFKSGSAHCILEGGYVSELSPVKRNWTGIMMQGGPIGVYFNFIDNMIVSDPRIVIDFNATTGQWINGNTFVNIQSQNFVRGIEFDFKGTHTDDVDGFYGNTFRDSQFQAGPMTTYGVKDIRHQYNAFYNVQFWDLPSGAISSNIDSSADNTMIIGGQMTYQGFVDNGKNSIVLDSWHKTPLSNLAIASAIINGTFPPKMNMSTPALQGVLNMSIISQAASNSVKGNHGQLVLSPGQSTVVNIFGTVTNSEGGSVLLSITRPDGVVEQNQADVTTSGAFYYPIIIDKNSLNGLYRIDGSYQDSNLGSLFLNVTTVQIIPNESSNTNTSITPVYESNNTIAIRIKNDAKLWSQGEISNEVFLNSLQYLVNMGIIKNSDGSQTTHQSVNIPTWIKNNAGWWANGQISDRDFFAGVEYLLKSGIILMPSS